MAGANGRVKRSRFGQKNRINTRTIPTKRTINFAEVGVDKISIPYATIGIVLIIIAAAIFGKVAVYDRLSAVYELQYEANQIQQNLDDCYAQLEDYDDVEDNYAHFTYSGLSEEELTRVNRSDIIDLIDKEVLPYAQIEQWSVSSNQLFISVNAKTLGEINSIVKKLGDNRMVSYCTVTTAETDDSAVRNSTESYEMVTGQIVVLLNSSEE